jgi:hypothetical protein
MARRGEMRVKLRDVKLPGALVDALHPEFRRTILRFLRQRYPGVLNEYQKWKQGQRQKRKKKKTR